MLVYLRLRNLNRLLWDAKVQPEVPQRSRMEKFAATKLSILNFCRDFDYTFVYVNFQPLRSTLRGLVLLRTVTKKWRRRGYKLYWYATVIKKMINKIIQYRRFNKPKVFVYKFKQHLFTRTFPGECCLTIKAALPPPNFMDLRKWIKHT